MAAGKTFKKAERMFFVFDYLSNHQTATAPELAQYCQTSVRSIYRDVRDLQDQGVEIQPSGRDGYKLLFQSHPVNGRLTHDEWMALTLFPMLSEGITSGDHPFHLAYKKGLEKVMGVVQGKSQLLEAGAGLGDRIRLHARPRESEQMKIMPQLLNAIAGNQEIYVTYYSIHRDTTTKRRLQPYYLVPREGHLYLIAFCHFRQDVRVFRVSRFQDVEVTDTQFTIPRTFNIDEFLEHRWTIISEEEATTFVVKFSDKAARYVAESEFYVDTSREASNDGGLFLTATVDSREEFLRWIRSFGVNAEVIEPLSVREQMREELQELMKIYAND